MARLFKRACKVTIYRTAEPGSFIASNPQFFVQQPNAIEVSELRVQFKIEKSLESSPNACEVTITNDMLHHAVDFTPYEGTVVKGWPVLVLSRGEKQLGIQTACGGKH